MNARRKCRGGDSNPGPPDAPGAPRSGYDRPLSVRRSTRLSHPDGPAHGPNGNKGMRRRRVDALQRRSERGSRVLAEEMLSHESQRRRAESEQLVVEFAGAGLPVLIGPVRTELLDHELAERVIQVSGIPGASLRLAFRGQSVP